MSDGAVEIEGSESNLSMCFNILQTFLRFLVVLLPLTIVEMCEVDLLMIGKSCRIS